MIVFAFTVLAFVLFGVALAFAYLHVRAQFREAMKRESRARLKAINEQRGLVATLTARVDALLIQAAKAKGEPPPMPVNPFQRSEDRHLRAMSTVVKVGDTPVKVG